LNAALVGLALVAEAAVSLEERASLPRAEHRIDSRTGLMIIGER